MAAKGLRRFCAAMVMVGAAVVLTACAQPGGGGATPASGRIQASPPPSDYVVVGSAAGTDVGTNFESGDLPLSLFFGLHFVAAANDAKPAHPGTAGAGNSVRAPIRFDPPVGSNEELDTALAWLAGRYPDRSDVKGWLLRSPGSESTRQYLLYVQLKSVGAADAVYIDVTRWAETHRNIGS